ncbi:MAG: hypothetical protein WD669_09380 [Pirellulales bacterium]
MLSPRWLSLCLFVSALISSASIGREWHRADGSKYCDGKLINIENRVATILSDSGTMLSIRIDELSLDDLSFVQEAISKRDQLIETSNRPGPVQLQSDVTQSHSRPAAVTKANDQAVQTPPDVDKFPLVDRQKSAWQCRPDPAAWNWSEPIDTANIAKLPPVQNEDGLIFSSAPSPFVAIAQSPAEDGVWEVRDLRFGRRTGLVRGMRHLRFPPLINAQGTLAANISRDETTAVDIWSFDTGTRVNRIRVSRQAEDLALGFVANDGILVKQGFGQLAVYGAANGELRAQIPFSDSVSFKTAISPGGHYAAVLNRDASRVTIYDSRNGGVAGDLALPDVPSLRWQCRAMAFSEDGARLLAHVTTMRETRILTWDLTDGKLSSVATGEETTRAFQRSGSSQWPSMPRIAEMTGQQALLLGGLLAVDAATGKPIWDYDAGDDRNKNPIQRFVGKSQMLVLRGSASSYSIAVERIPTEEINASKSIAAEGGTVRDAGLPPLTIPKWPAELEPKPIAAADHAYVPTAPIASTNLSGQIALKLDEDPADSPSPLEFFVVGGERPTAAVLSRYLGRDRDGKMAKVAVFDLSTSKPVLSFNLPRVINVLDLASDGSTLVTNSTNDGRIDIWNNSSGQHVLGFRPSRPSQPISGRTQVSAARVVNTSRLLTADRDAITLWDLDAPSPIYSLSITNGSTTGLDFGRRHFVAEDSHGVRVCEVETGKAVATLDSEKLPKEGVLAEAVFRDDGNKVALLFRAPTAHHLIVWNVADGGDIVCNMNLKFRATQMAWSGEDVLLGNVVGAPELRSDARPIRGSALELGYEHRSRTSGETMRPEYTGAILRVSPAVQRVVWTYTGRGWKIAGQMVPNRAWLAKYERTTGVNLVSMPGRTSAEEKALSLSAARDYIAIRGEQIGVEVEVGSLPDSIDRAEQRKEEMRASLAKALRSKMTAHTLRVSTAKPVLLRATITERRFSDLRGFGDERFPGMPGRAMPTPLRGADASGVLGRMELLSAEKEPVWFAEAWFMFNPTMMNTTSTSVDRQMQLLATWERALQWLMKEELPATIVDPVQFLGAGSTNLDATPE